MARQLPLILKVYEKVISLIWDGLLAPLLATVWILLSRRGRMVASEPE